MPLYLDVHEVPGASLDDIREAHEADVVVQEKYGVDYRKFWHNESCGKAFCLVEAPDEEAARKVHKESHGLLASKIIEVDPDMVDGFLGGGSVGPCGDVRMPGREPTPDTAVRTIMFTDIVGSTELAQRLGDQVALEMISTHDAIVKAAVSEADGRVIKHTGDGIMAVFISPVKMIRAACRIQAAVEALEPDETRPDFKVRIGAASGEPIESNDDFFGTTVNLAARLCGYAGPGKIIVASGIAEQCLGKGVQFGESSDAELKGFDEPIRTREVITCSG